MERIALALGSNKDDRLASLRAAVKALAPYVEVTAASSVYETLPLYLETQPLFLNAALVGTTKLAPLALMWNLKRIEMELGRTPTFRYGPRVIDLDLIFYDDQMIATPELNVPHLHMAEREFVLRPLAEIAPDWVHPQLGLTVAALLKRLPNVEAVNVGPLM